MVGKLNSDVISLSVEQLHYVHSFINLVANHQLLENKVMFACAQEARQLVPSYCIVGVVITIMQHAS